ncbi:hypothetical protein [Saccharothrix sp. NRRL B-16314]|uniref:hypothetical protein n=1 Tax=Saccharothrix sp. NRRL B-16314 TaxID=1463825 RepID=UPI000526B9C1|nr:hypothetical protein [Saccharothrix sp. NRRL B-16314]
MIAAVAGVCVFLFLAVAVLVRLRGRWAVPGTIGRALRWTGVAATVGVGVALLPGLSAEGGSAAAYLLGVPLVAAAAVVVSDLAGRAVAFVTTVVALVMGAWGLVLGLGLGFYFVVPALVFGIAALTSVRPRGLTTPSA